MGMTLWIHTLQDRDMSRESDDHSLMHDRADDLDALCERLGVLKLSSFFDMTDLEYNFGDEMRGGGEDQDDDEEGEEEGDVDPETGYAYGIDDMQWFDAGSGLATLEALSAALLDEAVIDDLQLEEEECEVLLDELEDCITQLKDLDAGGRFHLAVIS